MSLDRKSNVEDFIKKANKIHNNIYDYSLVDYNNARTKVEIICPKHKSFFQTPNHHLRGEGCPICNQSSGERLVESILLKYNILFEREVTFKTKEIVRNAKEFRVDFVITINKIKYFIEYNGIQHYQPIEFFGGEKQFILQQKRDNYVRNFVKRNKDFLKLLELSYKLNSTTVEKKILKFLNINQAPISNN